MNLKTLDILTKVFIAFSIVYWVGLLILAPESRYAYDGFGLLLSLMPLLGVIAGMKLKKQWGGFGSLVGKSITFISLALLAWFIGQSLWLGFSFLYEEVPYPGLPDLAFILIDPFYALALINVMAFNGAKRNIKGNNSYKFLAFLLLPLISIYITYTLFFGDSSYFEMIDAAVLFDLIYAIGSILIMTLLAVTFVFSFSTLGGKMRKALYLLGLGIVLQYLGDISFSIEGAIGEVFSGSLSDFIYFLSIAVVTLGLLSLNANKLDSKKPKQVESSPSEEQNNG